MQFDPTQARENRTLATINLIVYNANNSHKQAMMRSSSFGIACFRRNGFERRSY